MKKHILKALSLAAIFTLSFTNTWALDYVNGTPSVTNITQNAATIQIEVDQFIPSVFSYYVVLESIEVPPSLTELTIGYRSGTPQPFTFWGYVSYQPGSMTVSKTVEGLG